MADPSQIATRDVVPPEGSGMPAYKFQAEGNVRELKNLERPGRTVGPTHLAFFKQSGCDATTANRLLSYSDLGGPEGTQRNVIMGLRVEAR